MWSVRQDMVCVKAGKKGYASGSRVCEERGEEKERVQKRIKKTKKAGSASTPSTPHSPIRGSAARGFEKQSQPIASIGRTKD